MPAGRKELLRPAGVEGAVAAVRTHCDHLSSADRDLRGGGEFENSTHESFCDLRNGNLPMRDIPLERETLGVGNRR